MSSLVPFVVAVCLTAAPQQCMTRSFGDLRIDPVMCGRTINGGRIDESGQVQQAKIKILCQRG